MVRSLVWPQVPEPESGLRRCEEGVGGDPRGKRAVDDRAIGGNDSPRISEDPRLWGPYALLHALAHFAAIRFEDCRSQLSDAERDLLRPYAHLWNKTNGCPAFHRSRAECGIDRLFLSCPYEQRDLECRLSNDLRAIGFRVWMAVESVPAGVPWAHAIQNALERECDTILCLGRHQQVERLKDQNSFQSRELSLACCQGKGVIVLAVASPMLVCRLFTNIRL
ncbi:MAG: TIR domain-containing protein [Isosphaeraceae bacterium]